MSFPLEISISHRARCWSLTKPLSFTPGSVAHKKSSKHENKHKTIFKMTKILQNLSRSAQMLQTKWSFVHTRDFYEWNSLRMSLTVGSCFREWTERIKCTKRYFEKGDEHNWISVVNDGKNLRNVHNLRHWYLRLFEDSMDCNAEPWVRSRDSLKQRRFFDRFSVPALLSKQCQSCFYQM